MGIAGLCVDEGKRAEGSRFCEVWLREMFLPDAMHFLIPLLEYGRQVSYVCGVPQRREYI